MNTRKAWIGSAGCFALAFVATANAQEKPAVQGPQADFHRMEIYNGPFRMVQFFAAGASAAEQANLREIERSENDAALADQLLALRRQYVANERILENQRRQFQQLLYAYPTQISAGLLTGTLPAAYPFGYGYSSPYDYGSFLYGGSPYLAGFAGIASVNGAWGIGEGSPIKVELARTLASQATPEYATQAYRQYYNALAHAGEPNSRIATVAGVPSKGGIRPLEYQPAPGELRLTRPGAHVVLTRKLGDSAEKVEGTVVSETGDWVVLDTKAGKRSLAKSTIVDVLESK